MPDERSKPADRVQLTFGDRRRQYEAAAADATGCAFCTPRAYFGDELTSLAHERDCPRRGERRRAPQ